jgi:hypothetical protein
MGKVDERGQLYEAHTLRSGEVVWFYSDQLHKVFQLAELYKIDVYTLSGMMEAKKLLKKNALVW